MNLSMTGELAATYKSGSQRARVVTETWGEHNLYCPNCSSPKLDRLSHNTKAGDFSCPSCKSWFQLKGQKTRIGNSITDGAYEAMMDAIQNDRTPNFYFMHYDLATWSIKNLLLVPSFAFPASAIIKRNPLALTARRAGWIGCNIALNRIPIEARISLVTERQVISEKEVREKFQRVKPLKEISVKQRGWTLDVLNIVHKLDRAEFTNDDVYAYDRELEQLHPGNKNVRPKIRQQLQVLRDAGLLIHVKSGRWRIA
jgi:type II restriction enzyme